MADPAYIVDGVLTDGEAWVGLATTTLGVDTTSVTFTSTDDGQVGDFSQYMDLVLVSYMATDRASTNDLMKCHLNGDTTNVNYTYQYIWGSGDGTVESGSSASGARGIESRLCSAASSTNIFTAIVMNFFDVNSGKYKSVLTRTANDVDAAIQASTSSLTSSTWLSQAPITSMVLAPNTGSNLAAGSMFSLFGVLPRMVA
jgi:hypothetical protein